MPRLDVLLTGYDITDEIINRASSTALALGHDTIRGTADLEIWTGAGGTGTQLALTTDYTVSDEDADLSTEAGVSIYTKLAIVNGTYHDTALYVTYKTIGDYASAETVRAFDAEYTEVTGNYTVLATDRYLRITTASAITITIPDTMPDNWPLTFSRTVASANAVTVATSGAETIEGAATFVTHGAFEVPTTNDVEVVLRKKTTADWRFVSGEVAGSNAEGSYRLFPSGDGVLEMISAAKSVSSGDGNVNRSTGFDMPYPITPVAVKSFSLSAYRTADGNTMGASKSSAPTTATFGGVNIWFTSVTASAIAVAVVNIRWK